MCWCHHTRERDRLAPAYVLRRDMAWGYRASQAFLGVSKSERHRGDGISRGFHFWWAPCIESDKFSAWSRRQVTPAYELTAHVPVWLEQGATASQSPNPYHGRRTTVHTDE